MTLPLHAATGPSRSSLRFPRFRGQGAAALVLAISLAGAVRCQEQGGAPAGEPMTDGRAGGPAASREEVETLLSPAYGGLNLDGDRAEFYRYFRPPTGLYLGLLHALRRDAAGVLFQEGWWRNPGEADQKGYLDLHLRRVPAYLRLRREAAEFAGDPQLPGGGFSRRSSTDLRAHLQGLDPGPAVDIELREHRVMVPELGRLQPFRAIDYRAREISLAAVVPVGAGQLSVEPGRLSFDDRTGRLPHSDTSRIAAELDYPAGPRGDLSASYDRIVTDLARRETATWDLLRLGGSYRVRDDLHLDFFWRSRDVDLPATRTPYADRTRLIGLSAAARPWRRGSLQAGLFREEIRRSGDGVEDTSGWTGGWMRFRAARPGLGSFSFRYREKRLDHAPRGGFAATPDADSLYYTRHRRLDTRLDLTRWDRAAGYLSYGHQARENDESGTRLTLDTASVGTVLQLSSRTTLTGEYTLQIWDGDTGPLRSAPGGPAGILSPRLFFSDARVLTGSLVYQISDRSALELSVHAYSATGGRSARDHLAVLQYRREARRGFFYSIGYQYERFQDNRGGDYSALPLLLQTGFTRRF